MWARIVGRGGGECVCVVVCVGGGVEGTFQKPR